MKTAVMETGISDHHKMIFSILKHTFAEEPPRTICFRNLKNFDRIAFNSYLESKMADCTNFYEKFLQVFYDTAQLFAPLKKKIIRCNNKTFMTKRLRKVIMTCSKLGKKYKKKKDTRIWINFKNQRSKCDKILRNVKKEYLSDLNIKGVADRREFGQQFNHFSPT